MQPHTTGTAATKGRLADTPTSSSPRERVVGVLAISLFASLVIQNAVVIAAGSPSYAAPMTEVLAFHAEHRLAVAVAVGLEALNLPLLLGFLTGLHGLVEHRGRGGADWSRLAVLAGATLAAALASYAVLWVGTTLAADGLTESSPAFELAWRMHAAAFALSLPALGTVFIGASLAAHAGGLTPPWTRLVGLTGGSLLIAAGAGTLAIADGSAILFLGMPGFIAWFAWLLVAGVRLVRAGSR